MKLKGKNLITKNIFCKSSFISLVASLFFLFCQNVESQNQTFPDPNTPFTEQRNNMAQLRADFKARVNGYISYLKDSYKHNTFTAMLSFGDHNLLCGYVPDGNKGEEFEVFIRTENRLKYGYIIQPNVTMETAFIPGEIRASTRRNGDITTTNSFFFLYDALYPPDKSKNTAWHEAQHGAMRNGVSVADDHIYIREYAEKIIETVLPKLARFEKKIEEDWQKSKGKKLSDFEEHEIWKESHEIWLNIQKNFSEVARLTDEQKREYRNLTGIYFPDIATLENLYKTGGHKGIRPPEWVFYKDLLYKDVFIKTEPPLVNKNGQIELSFSVSAHPFKIEKPDSGLIKVKIESLFVKDAYFEVYGDANKNQALSNKVKEWTYDLSKGQFTKGYLVVSTDEDITIKVSYEYVSKPNYDILKDYRYRPTSASVRLTKFKEPCTYKYSDWSECDPKTAKQTRKVVSKEPKDCIEKDSPILEQPCPPEQLPCTYTYSDWSPCDKKTKKQTRRVISKSPDKCIEKDRPVLERVCPPDNGAAEGDKPGDKPSIGDPKKLAEEKYQWIKAIPGYLEALIELDKKTYASAVKEIRKTVLSKAAAGAYPQCDTACQKRINEIRKSIGECGPHIVKERREDPLTGKIGLINVIKEGKPCSEADKAKAEEAARLSDPMAYEEFKCYEQITKPFKDNQQDLKRKLTEVNGSKVLKNYQEYIAWNMYKEYVDEANALKAKLRLPEPIPSPIVLPWSYRTSCGGADGAGVIATDKRELKVVLTKSPDKAAYKIGDLINVTASVTGGKEPYTYTWTGDYAGKGPRVAATLSKPGDYTLSVEVKDASGKSGNATLTIKVEGIEADIAGLPNTGVYGTVLPISVQVKGMLTQDTKKGVKKKPVKKFKTYEECKHKPRKGGLIAPDCDRDGYDENCNWVCLDGYELAEPTKEYRFVWHSDKEGIEFDPSTSYSNRTKVLLSRMGKIKIWAQVQKSTGENVFSTVGETPQKEITVVAPKFEWTFNPPKGQGKVGKEVKATITTNPPIKPELIYYRWSYPESSNRWEDDHSASAIRFIPKDPKPLMLLVQPEVPHYRDLIGGGLKEEYQAGTYTVTVGKPRYVQSKPKIWKCDTQLGGAQKCGLYEVEYEFAVFHNILMRADLSPQHEEPRFKWSMTPEGCRIHNDIVQEITFDCSKTGTYTATVTVRDKDNIILGTGLGMVSITISSDMLTESAKKAKEYEDKQKAKIMLQKAKGLAKEGKIDEAVSIVQEAAKIDKTAAQPVMNEVSQVAKNAGWDALSKGDYKTAIKRLEQAVALNPADTDAQNKLKGARDYEAKMPMVEAKMREFDRLIQEKKVVSSYQKLLEVQDILRTMAMGQSAYNPVIIKYNEEYAKLNKWYNELIQKTNAEWTRLFQAKDWAKAEALLKDVLRYEHTEANRRNYEGSLQMVRQMLRQQAECEAKWSEGRALYDAKRYSEALNKFKENLACAPNNQERRNYIAQLEQSLRQQEAQRQAEAKKAKMTADRLWEQGIALYGQRKMSEALDKFKESLIHWQDPQRTDYVGALEGKKSIADRLWDECTALVNQNRLNEALSKCKESLNYWPSDKRLAVVKDIDFKLKQPHTPPTKPPTTSDTVVDSRTSKSKGYWRLVDRKSETKQGSNCYPVDVLGDEGNIIVNMRSVCGENGIVRVRAEWTTPPERLIPNENLRLDAALIPESISGTNRGIDEGMEIKFDNADIKCGYTTAGRIKIIEGLGAGVGKAGGKKTGEAKVPEKGRFKPDNLLKLSVCLRYYHQYYTYHWTEGTSGAGSSTNTIPTNIPGNTQVIFNNGNIGGVYNSPTRSTTFTINQPHVITLIQNYHWNNARGSMPGTIALRDQNGRTYGPWQAKGSPGQGGVHNAYWTVYPNITIPTGTYTVIDSEPSTWAQNSGSQGSGHTRIEGYPISSNDSQQAGGHLSGDSLYQTQRTITAEFKNSSGNQNIHIFAEGQDSFGPHNRITPGATIKVNIKPPSQGGFIKFAAGRNGQVLATCRWEYDPNTISTRVPVVTFNEPNRLSCATGHR